MSAPVPTPQIIIVFGPSGSGKTFVGQQIGKSMGFHFYDGDSDLTQDVKDALVAGQPVTTEMRVRLYSHFVEKTKKLLASEENVVFAQTLPKDSDRQIFLKAFPAATFVWVDATDHVIAKRRQTEAALRAVFEEPDSSFPYTRFVNDADGIRNLARFLRTSALRTLTPQYTVERYRSFLADGAKGKIDEGAGLLPCPQEERVSTQHIPDFVPSLDLYLYKPNFETQAPQPIYIYLPASFVGMNAAIFGVICKKLCALSGRPIAAFKYPLSPEASLSTQINATTKAYEKLVGDGRALGLNIDTSNIALGGYSSGGYLALHVTKNVLTKNIPTPTKLLLPFPALDVGDAIEGNPKDPIVNKSFIDWLFFQPFVNETQPIRSFSLLHQDFTAFPPMTIITSNWDYSLGHVMRLKELNPKAEIRNVGDSGHADFWYDPKGKALALLAQILSAA
ncbi:MAG: alpha/beta hydrolase fold domain-containing protein [Alphaproteobacteria bacterium]|nr:alpha/beta hydrolase fold domain-containing protein [Alphaproteobacteria bacterium]